MNNVEVSNLGICRLLTSMHAWISASSGSRPDGRFCKALVHMQDKFLTSVYPRSSKAATRTVLNGYKISRTLHDNPEIRQYMNVASAWQVMFPPQNKCDIRKSFPSPLVMS